MIERVTIVGRGALGIMLADAFERELGPEGVCFLADGERLERYRREGTYYNGEKRDFRFSDGSGETAQLLIFAVKATALEQAMDLAAPVVGEDTIILSALNGVESEEILALRFGWEKVLYMVTQGLDPMREDNRVLCAHRGPIHIGIPEEDYFDRSEKADLAVEVFQRAGLAVQREEDILHRIWCKFMLNVGVNQVCTAMDVPFGGVQQPGLARETMIAAMNEARKVGACQGVLVTQKDLQEYVALVDAVAPEGMPSMRQDALAHRKTEVETFAGQVLDMAERYGMQVPVNRKLYDTIRAMEDSWENS